MHKIPTLFERDFTTLPPVLTDKVTPGCEWVLAGEGIATRKYDGTCVMLDANGSWWARREVKVGKRAPAAFVLEEANPFTGHLFGWEPITDSPFHKQFRDAFEHDESLWEEVVVR